MSTAIHKHFTFNFKNILKDEIALEGLEGIGLNTLWKRVEKRICSPITEKMKIRFWQLIINFDVTFYKLPQPFIDIESLDRFTIVHQDSGQLLDPPDYVDGPYEYSPVEDDYGSCVHYNTRVFLPKNEINALSYNEVLSKYGNRLTIVASLDERWKALACHLPITYLSQLTSVHYCILELVGRARENGQMTVGKTNLTKIMKDPKHLFYNRKHLQQLGLLKIQCHTQVVMGRGMKSLLLRLKRFHKPIILSTPKTGIINNMIEYLKQKPDHCEKVDTIIGCGLLTQHQSKRLQKTINVFHFEDKQVLPDENSKSKKHKLSCKKRYISFAITSDESSQSDEDTNDTPLKCQFKVGVNLLRQAYERFLEAGLKGLTNIEMAQILGVEFYTSRTICRTLKLKKLVKEFLEDTGRQRTARYIAIAATGEMENKYAEEKKKFMNFLNTAEIKDKQDTEDEQVPIKKIKLDDTEENQSDCINTEITEVKVIEGLESTSNESLINSKRSPTLRQLKFANGVLQIIREKRFVCGYQTLSNLVSKATGEPPMDTKALKLFVQKLVKDQQLKMFQIKWPGFLHKYTILICEPTLSATDPIIKTKYKEISMKAITSKKTKVKRALMETCQRPLSLFAYPRYMKIQKLHELVISVVYFNDIKIEDFPKGFVTVLNIIPEMTVGFAVGNISNVAISDISHLKISDNILELKLKDAPPDLFEKLIQSKSLQNSIRFNLKALAMLGLIQLVSEIAHPPDTDDYGGNLISFLFYVNRTAKILDTTGVWPKQNTHIQSLEKSYYFENFEDVTKYWSDVYNISTNTNIESVVKRGQKKVKPPVRKMSEVEIHDNGERYGDTLGPCAFDSSFFMDIPRLWRTFYIRNAKSNQPTTKRKKQIQNPKVDIPKKPWSKRKIKKKILKPTVNEFAFNKRKRTNQRDSLVKWSKWEDSMIMLCKAAITIMSPTPHPDCLKVRNAIAKEILMLSDPKKTASACHRRAATLESNSTLAHEKECILNEIRRQRHLIQKYEGLLKKLRNRYSTNLSKLFKECRIPMLELVWTMCRMSRCKSFSQRLPCIAIDLKEFSNKYTISTTSPDKFYNLYKTPVDGETIFASIKEGILLTTMLSFNNAVTSEMASKIYTIFKDQPELRLRSALEELRKSGAIAAKDKLLNNHLHRIHIEEIVQSSYKISASYQRKWNCKINSEFIYNIGDSLFTEVPQGVVKASSEINCLFCELCASDVLDVISITTPVITGHSGSIMQEEQLNVIDIENKYTLKSGTVGCKNKTSLKKFNELYEHVDLDECVKILNSFSIIPFIEESAMDIEDVLISHLREMSEKGSTFKELLKFVSCDTKSLVDQLSNLESMKLITRVGFYENKVVLTTFVQNWSLKVDDKFIIPVPWLTLNGSVRLDIFLKWAGTIVNKVFECPGISISYLSDACEMLTCRAIQDICTFLQMCECVKLNCVEAVEPDLFSEQVTTNEIADFNQYEQPENIIVLPTKKMLTTFSYVRKRIFDHLIVDNKV